MTSYRLHIYGMAQDVVSEAISYLLYYQNNYQYEENLDALRLRAALLSERVESLNSSLPVEVKHGADNRPNMAWVNWSVKERGNVPHLPGNLLDIVKRDIPGLLRIFDEWYERRSLAGADLDDRLRTLISGGQLTDALRVSWPFFKTRMARKFSLDEGLDGPKLVDELFGPKGAASHIYPKQGELEGYRNLLKGLYALNRNVVMHNDVEISPAESEAIIALLCSVIARVEFAAQ